MNVKLIFYLSLFGLIFGTGTLFFLPVRFEPIVWILYYFFASYWIAKSTEKRFFLHGFLTCLLCSAWVITIHLLFFSEYSDKHSGEMQFYQEFSILNSPRIMVLIYGTLVALCSSLILGLFCIFMQRVIGNRSITFKDN